MLESRYVHPSAGSDGSLGLRFHRGPPGRAMVWLEGVPPLTMIWTTAPLAAGSPAIRSGLGTSEAVTFRRRDSGIPLSDCSHLYPRIVCAGAGTLLTMRTTAVASVRGVRMEPC